MSSDSAPSAKESQCHYRPETIYGFGSNGSGQLGVGHTDDLAEAVPLAAFSLNYTAYVANIACGGNHTVILFSDGKVATVGDNSDGRCMVENEVCSTKFRYVSVLDGHSALGKLNAEHVAATWASTLIVTTDGRLFACGTGSSGELGLGEGKERASTPQLIKDFPPSGTKVVSVASCMAHTVAVLSNGEIWGWGKGRQGQLGQSQEHRWKPTKIDNVPFFVFDAVCGKDFTCVVGHPSSGELLMLGPGGKDRFRVKADAPTTILGWKQVAASWGSVFVLLDSGKLLSWGRGDHGQLPPMGMPSLKSIAAGSEHCIGLATEDGKVLAWGWGEHGNCGPNIDDNGDVKGRWIQIQMVRPAITVFAGCATSFAIAESLPEG